MGIKHTVAIGFVLSLIGANPVTADEDLGISPTFQQNPVWCWAAVSEMVLSHFGYSSINPAGNFQCGVVAMLGGVCNLNCGACGTGIGNTSNLAEVLRRYQQVAAQVGADGEKFISRLTGKLSANRIVDEIDAGRPVIAGINPSGMGKFYPPGFGEHVALIEGYKNEGNDINLIVNDPFPYRVVGHDPYISAGAEMVEEGQYLIARKEFVRVLGYKDSIYFK